MNAYINALRAEIDLFVRNTHLTKILRSIHELYRTHQITASDGNQVIRYLKRRRWDLQKIDPDPFSVHYQDPYIVPRTQSMRDHDT